jgi:hypothetical protein
VAQNQDTQLVHALAHQVGPGWVLSQELADVVLFTDVRADLFISAARVGKRVIVVTPQASRLSEIYRDVMEQLGGYWVVRADAGYFYDGMTGLLLHLPQDALDAALPASLDEVAPAFLELEEAPETVVRFVTSVRLKAAIDTVIGLGAEAMSTLGSSSAPDSWGRHEPVVHGWDRDNVTEYAQSRIPADTTVTYAGSPAAPLTGTITVRRTDKGVEEITSGLVAVGPAHSDQARDAVGRVPEAIDELARFGLPLFAVLFASLGRRDLALTPHLRPPATPIALVLGAPAVRQLGFDLDAQVERFSARIIGRPKIPGFSYPLADTGWDGLAEIMAQVPQQRLLDAIGPQLFLLLAERGAVAPA